MLRNVWQASPFEDDEVGSKGDKRVVGHAGITMESGWESGGTYDAVIEARWTQRVRGWARGKEVVFYVKGEKNIIEEKDDTVEEEESRYSYNTLK